MQQAISAGHETTLAVAKEILLAKGNAFDAAIAAHFAMFIAEPCMASAGGNGFALTRTAKGDIQFFDFFCQTPINKKNLNGLDFYPVEIDFGSDSETFHVGLGSAAVPGSIAGVFEMHRRFGTIPMKELVQPAIQLAKEGVPLDTFQAFDFQLLEPIFRQDPKVKNIFFKPNGKIKEEGDLIQMPRMADFLTFIASEGKRGFYQGEIAKKIAEDSQQRGGFLMRADFENYQVNVLDPLKFNYKNRIIYLPNGPSKGGAMLAMMLSQVNKNESSLALAMETTQSMVADEFKIKTHLDHLVPNNNFKFQPSISSNRGTSHFNILDRWGNAVSLTSSIGEGCGYFIPDTNMQLNNMLGEIFLLPDGAHSWVPNTRLHSMMTPTIITQKNGDLEFIAGSGGAGRIPFAIGQVIFQLYEKQNNLRESTHHPRVHFQEEKFQIERGFDFSLEKENTVFWEELAMYFGGVHSIFNDGKKLEAIGDVRRYGVAEVF
ncbi:MAG: gamma-glutamyltransferase [Saprospiraceae bacterium]